MDTMKKIHKSWLIANVAGFWGGFIIGIIIIFFLAFYISPMPDRIWAGVIGFSLGAAVGLGQYLALRSRLSLSNSFIWIFACAIGLSVGFLVEPSAFRSESNPITASLILRVLMAGLIAGAIIGILQWLTLRKNYSKVWMWIIANISAGPLVTTTLLIPVIYYDSHLEKLPKNLGSEYAFIFYGGMCFLLSPLAGLFQGLITWIPLRMFLRERANEDNPAA